MVIIGSTAIKHHFPDFQREPKDIDWIGQGENIPGKVEFHTNPVFDCYEGHYLSPNDLYTLKISHLFWDIHWEKHMWDVQFLKKKGCKLNKRVFDLLYAYWNTIHEPNKRSNLQMSADDFFDNAVKTGYSHDDLHTLINPIPTYTKILIGEVEVGEDRFNVLTHSEKCALVTEEVMVMAWERYRHLDYRRAYGRMLKKFIIGHAPLWEAVFIIENFIELHKPTFNYFNQIENRLNTVKQAS